MAAIVKPTLQFLLDWTRPPDLCLSADFLQVVRDFSVTGRIGELAQGVSFAYWKWTRGYSWIADFGPWVSKSVPPYSVKKSPDFVMFNLTSGDVAIMEAKGTRSADHRAPMRAALHQCNDALPHVLATRGFGSVLTLNSKNPAGAGTLHIRDPEGMGEIPEKMKHYLFRRSYASWFDLSGDEDQAKRFRDTPQNLEELAAQAKPLDQRPRAIDPLRMIATSAIGFDPMRTEFEIDPEVKAALESFNAFKSINWAKFSERMLAPEDPNKRLIRFPDGTLIIER